MSESEHATLIKLRAERAVLIEVAQAALKLRVAIAALPLERLTGEGSMAVLFTLAYGVNVTEAALRALPRELLAEIERAARVTHRHGTGAGRPTVVCLCGSTRFMQAFQDANLAETLAGRIVLTVGCDTKSDAMLDLGADVKARLDELHLRKINLADEVLVLNVGGYVGESTAREIAYARALGKHVRWLEPEIAGH